MSQIAFVKQVNQNIFPFTTALYIPNSSTQTEINFSVITDALKAFQELGFKPSLELLDAMQNMEYANFVEWFLHVCSLLEKQAGYSIKNAKVFYQNFPQEVIETSQAQLYVNAVRHYLSREENTFFPERQEDQHLKLEGYPELTTIHFSSQEKTEEFLINTLTSKASWGEGEVELIQFALKNDFDEVLIPHLANITNHENKAHLWCFANKNNFHKVQQGLEKTFTTTDVIRSFAALSGFSPALAPYVKESITPNKIKFVSIPNKTRKFFLSVIEQDKFAQITMAKHTGLWKKIGEKIHPGDFAKKYPKAFQDFKQLRSNSLEKENSTIEAYIQNNQIIQAIDALKARPGELVRRLDHLLRISNKQEQEHLLQTLAQISATVSTTVLWQAHAHFFKRNHLQARAIMPKGSVSKMQVLPALKEVFEPELIEQVTSILYEAILEQYKENDFLKEESYEIDKALFDIKIPTLRNSQSDYLNIGRGSRVNIPHLNNKQANIIRLFTHWKNIDHQAVDVDLSATLYSEDFQTVSNVWYGNLKEVGITHSGDITNAPEGASEYIDVDIKTVMKSHPQARYVGISITSYSGQSFTTIPECFAGVQVRDKAMQGQIFEAKTVVHKFTVHTDGRNTTPLLFDLKTNQMIWVDVNINSKSGAYQNVHNLGEAQTLIMKGILDYTAASWGEVIEANLQAQNKEYTIVDTITDQTISISSLNSQELVGKWL